MTDAEYLAACRPCQHCRWYGKHRADCPESNAPEYERAAFAWSQGLHQQEAHPDYLYATTTSDSGAAYPNDGNEHWQSNPERGHHGREFMGTHEAAYWMRRKTAPRVRGFWNRYPNVPSQLFLEAGYRTRPELDGHDRRDAQGYTPRDHAADRRDRD